MRVQLDWERIEACFAAEHQTDVLVELYKLVFPDWDAIERLDGYPQVNANTWKAICVRFMAYDQVHHPSVVSGGLWVNQGWSGADKKGLKDFEVSLEKCKALPTARYTLAS